MVGAIVAACALVVAGVVWWTLAPLEHPIHLVHAGDPDPEGSVREVCAEWRPDQRAVSRSRDWWIVVPRESSLHAEIRSAKRLLFEVDPGSGLSDVCLIEELEFQSVPDVVKGVLEACRRREGLWARRPEEQVALRVNAAEGDRACDKPGGASKAPSTPPN